MTAPKRFPDRDEIADVRAATDDARGRRRARRNAAARRARHGAPRDGEARLPRPRRPVGANPAHVRHGPHRRRRRPPRRRRRRLRPAGEVAARRAVARRRRADGARAQPQPAPRHVPRPDRHGDALPQALPRPAHERGVARPLPPAHERRLVDPSLPRRRGVRRGRDARPPASLRRRVRAPVRDALERAGRRSLPAHRDRALPQAADRGRARARLRDRQGLPQRERLVQAPARVHDARVVRGVRRLPRHDGPHRDDARAGRARCARHDGRDVPRPRDRPEASVAARRLRRVAGGARALDTRRGRAARLARRSAGSTRRPTRTGRSSSTTPSATSSSRASSSRRSSTDIPSSSRRSRASPTTTTRSPSGSSTSPPGWSSATRTRRSTTPTSSSAASTSSPSTSRACAAIRTTSRRSPTACRRRAGSVSGSTASSCSSRAARRSATSFSSRRCAPTRRLTSVRTPIGGSRGAARRRLLVRRVVKDRRHRACARGDSACAPIRRMRARSSMRRSTRSITIDHRGPRARVQPRAEQTFGYSRQDVLGRELAALIVPPAFRDAHRQALERWTEHGPAAGAGALLGRRIEVQAMRSDGTEFPAELAISRVDVPGPPALHGLHPRHQRAHRHGGATKDRRVPLPHARRAASAHLVRRPVEDDPSSKPLYVSPQIETRARLHARRTGLRVPDLYERAIHADDRERVLAEKVDCVRARRDAASRVPDDARTAVSSGSRTSPCTSEPPAGVVRSDRGSRSTSPSASEPTTPCGRPRPATARSSSSCHWPCTSTASDA